MPPISQSAQLNDGVTLYTPKTHTYISYVRASFTIARLLTDTGGVVSKVIFILSTWFFIWIPELIINETE